jgi:hypothetical protein
VKFPVIDESSPRIAPGYRKLPPPGLQDPLWNECRLALDQSDGDRRAFQDFAFARITEMRPEPILYHHMTNLSGISVIKSFLDSSCLEKSAKTSASLLFYEFNTPGLSQQLFPGSPDTKIPEWQVTYETLQSQAIEVLHPDLEAFRPNPKQTMQLSIRTRKRRYQAL